MIPVYLAHQVRDMDRYLIDSVGIPSHTLMEVAGRGAAAKLNEIYKSTPITIICGSGNNGGDGYVMARWLHSWRREVRLWQVAPPTTADAILNAQLCLQLNISLTATEPAFATDEIIVDALLGTGQSRPPSGKYLAAIQAINKAQQNGAKVCSVDVPTGIQVDTGSPFGEDYIQPNVTIGFGFMKRGQLSGYHIGRIEMIDIGLSLARNVHSKCDYILENHDVSGWWPVEQPTAAKWNRGHVAIIGGGGATVLAAHAALAAGAGLVSILMPQKNWSSLHGLRPEVILAEEKSLNAKKHDVLILGPGLGTDRIELVVELYNNFPNTIVIDADAITILSKVRPSRSKFTRIFTPHAAEAGRLLEKTPEQVTRDPFTSIKDLQKWGFAILKGPWTKIGVNPIYINPTGDNRLAIAGSGDVLTGLIATFCAKGLPPKHACALATYWHGLAGENLRQNDSATHLLLSLHNTLQQIYPCKNDSSC